MTGQATRQPVDAWLVGIGAIVGAVVIVAAAPTAVQGDPTVEVVTQVLLALAVGFGVLVVGLRRAAAVVVLSSLTYFDWYNAHLWLAIALFVPWWLWYVLGAGRSRQL